MEIYTGESRDRHDRERVGIADYAVGDEGSVLKTSGLGSCVGIALHDERAGVVGLAHAMLPRVEDESPDKEAKYADAAVRTLVAEMEARGADRDHIRAKLAGGSSMFDFARNGDGSIGERNAAVARETLESLGVRVVAEDVGGDRGRSLVLDGDTGDLRVRRPGDDDRVL